MQSLNWYRNRLLSMQPGEIAWRVSNLLRDKVDRALLPRRQKTLDLPTDSKRKGRADADVDLAPLVSMPASPPAAAAGWRLGLIAEADEILRHRIRLLGGRRVDVGTPIRWNHEHNKNASTPTGYAGDIDYRDYDETGDCKWVWELNRHHQLVVLGRGYLLTGHEAYAREVVDQLLSWIDACPFGTGMNWRSPLEHSIRLINWAYALELIGPADVVDEAARRRIESSIYQHIWDVSRKYSRYSSANNHLIGEAAGVFVAACRFPHLPNATAWRSEAQRILIEEIANQVDSDGVHRELATGYHLFVLQFFAIAYAAGMRSGDVFPADYAARLRSMCDFVTALSAAGPMPLFGDCDDGYVLDLGSERGDAQAWAFAASRLVGDSPESDAAPAASEVAFWLAGVDADDVNPSEPRPLASRRFDEAGVCLLQCGTVDRNDAISVAVDAGPLGFKSIAAHGHADALSITLRAFGVEFLIDPGTYDYFTYPEWRDYFRSTRAHNTIEIDSLDQSEMLGKFLWGRRANTRCIEWRSGAAGAKLVAEHDGYTRLSDPVTHRRTVALDEAGRKVHIDDELSATKSHNGAMYFHFAPACRVEQTSAGTIRAVRPEGAIELTLPEGVRLSLSRGETSPILGWCSRAYHVREPITTLRAKFDFNALRRLSTTVHIC